VHTEALSARVFARARTFCIIYSSCKDVFILVLRVLLCSDFLSI